LRACSRVYPDPGSYLHLVRHALAVMLLALFASACGAAEETEQSSDGTGTRACTADLRRTIGPEPELRGATWSPDGSRIAFAAWDGRRTSIYTVGVADCGLERIGPRANVTVGPPDWSSTNVLAFEASARGGGEEGIYTMSAAGGDLSRITNGPDFFPKWSPDGKRIAFVRGGYAEVTDDDPSPEYANRNVWVVGTDGSGPRQVTDGRWHGTADWSSDGKRVVTDAQPDVVEVGIDGRGRRVLLDGEYNDREYGDPSWSPDGEDLLVVTGPAGALGLAEGGQPPIERVDTPLGNSPEWSPDGSWIAFVDGENEADLWIVRPDGTGLRQLTTLRTS
jgi:Tol biopolymer transport system component